MAKYPHGEVTSWRNVLMAKCPHGEVSHGEVTHGKVTHGKVTHGKVTGGKVSGHPDFSPRKVEVNFWKYRLYEKKID